jgi:transposase
MPRAYSLDLRERVLSAAHEDTLSHGALAARFRVGASTIRGWLRRERATGETAPKPHGGGTPPKVDAAGAPILTALVREQNDRTLAELATLYGARTGVGLSVSAVWRACARLDLPRKKSR